MISNMTSLYECKMKESVKGMYGLLTMHEVKCWDIGLKVYNDIKKEWGQYPSNFSE